MNLKIHSLDNLLNIEGSGGMSVPYIGYVEVNLKIPEIKAYNEDVLMMVMNDSRCGTGSVICNWYHPYLCCIGSDN